MADFPLESRCFDQGSQMITETPAQDYVLEVQSVTRLVDVYLIKCIKTVN